MTIEKDANNETASTGYDRQPRAAGTKVVGKNRVGAAKVGREQSPGVRQSVSVKTELSPADRIADENLAIKKEMALAMLKMGISRTAVMEILNIGIK